MKGVIIAAGYGRRLEPLGKNVAKALVQVNGKAIITYPIDAFLAAGITEISIVLGYRGDDVRFYIEKLYPNVEYCYNNNYDGNNALSVNAASSFTDGQSFVLAMGDHIINTSIVKTLLTESKIGRTLCTDSKSKYSFQIDDGTKVVTDLDGRIVEIGKDLTSWQCVDTGVFMLGQEVLDCIKYLIKHDGDKTDLSSVVRHMAKEDKHFQICDVSGQFWGDVDTVEDHEAISNILKQGNGYL